MNIVNEFIYPLRIHIEDTDYGGVVYHSNYLKFMERARSEWLEGLGLDITWQRKHQLYFPVHSLHITFIKPARLHEHVEVVTRFKSLRRASMVFEQCLRLRDRPATLLCKAEIKIACVTDELRPCAIPDTPVLDAIRRAIT